MTEPSPEQPLFQYNFPDFETTSQKMAAEGYSFAGQERLTKIKFSPDAKFNEEPLQTEDQIKEKYREDGKYDVRLVMKLSSEMESVLKKWPDTKLGDIPDANKSFFVFTREARPQT